MTGGVLVLKLESALFYIDAEEHTQLLASTSRLNTRGEKPPLTNPIADKEPGWTWSH